MARTARGRRARALSVGAGERVAGRWPGKRIRGSRAAAAATILPERAVARDAKLAALDACESLEQHVQPFPLDQATDEEVARPPVHGRAVARRRVGNERSDRRDDDPLGIGAELHHVPRLPRAVHEPGVGVPG